MSASRWARARRFSNTNGLNSSPTFSEWRIRSYMCFVMPWANRSSAGVMTLAAVCRHFARRSRKPSRATWARCSEVPMTPESPGVGANSSVMRESLIHSTKHLSEGKTPGSWEVSKKVMQSDT